MNREDTTPASAEMRPLTLGFRDAGLEARYRAARAGGDLRQMRLSLIGGAVINALFFPLDTLVLSENLGVVVILRLGVATVAFATVFGLTFVRAFQRRLSLLAAAVIVAFTLIYVVILAVSGAPGAYLSGYVLVILFLLVFVPVGFVDASAISWSCTALCAALIPAVRPTSVGTLATVYFQFAAANLMGMFALYWMEKFHRFDFLNLERIDTERSRYSELLNRILPRSIVERLERGERSIGDQFADSTVLFADIVGFTELSAHHRPAEIVAFLNRVFARFDELVARHGVEKIKTIGDAYMAAGGLPVARAGHAEAIADLAVDMIAETDRMRGPDGERVTLRIGIHTGPLIAGVIGESRFLYDIWGDTVNTASRMESQGSPGRIQVSEPVYQSLQDRYRFEPHGEIEVRGKGRMMTWYLTGRRAE